MRILSAASSSTIGIVAYEAVKAMCLTDAARSRLASAAHNAARAQNNSAASHTLHLPAAVVTDEEQEPVVTAVSSP